MGLLDLDGEPLTFEQSKQYQKMVKEKGIQQFFDLYLTYKDLQVNGPFKWGDEIEFQLFEIDQENKTAKLQINTDYIFDNENLTKADFKPLVEYGSWMIETTPNFPYNQEICFHEIYNDIQSRKQNLKKILKKNDKIFSLSTFPRLGNKDYFTKYEKEDYEFLNNPYSKSSMIDDVIIQKHLRFRTLSQNIRMRRGSKVDIKIPIFRDQNTKDDHIYMDAMAYGMGASCLQMTLSSQNIENARFLYDQLAILSPLFLALSASSPIFNGKLADTDTRWSVICQSVDCRTEEERDKNSQKYISKSRYDSISYYLCSKDKPCFRPEYNDLKNYMDPEIKEYILEQQKVNGVELDENLIQHLNFLFTRDSLALFSNQIKDNKRHTKFFENIQSTNWNSVRFKPPPSLDSDIPWRVEFRTLEVQMTTKENTFILFLAMKLASQFYRCCQMNLYLPISLVDENFKRAEQKDAILKNKFYFRTNIFDQGPPEIKELSLYEIFLGGQDFKGIVTILLSKICNKDKDEVLICDEFMTMLKNRLTGKNKTFARWQRDFVLNHPKYNKDSIVTEEIQYDLLNALLEIYDQEDENSGGYNQKENQNDFNKKHKKSHEFFM